MNLMGLNMISKQKIKSVKVLHKGADKLREVGVDDTDIAEAFLEVAVAEALKFSRPIDVGVWLASAGKQVAGLDVNQEKIH